MLVEKYMATDIVSVTPQTKVLEALDLMEKNDIHRLPVLDKNGKLLGLVTEGVIERATPSTISSLSMHELNYLLNRTTIEDVMIKKIVTIGPDALLEEAASLMMSKEIGVLPVMDHDNLVGIITNKDIMRAFVDILGYNTKGTRVVVDVENKVGVLEVLTDVISEADLNISQIAVFNTDEGTQVVVHVMDEDSDRVRQIIEAAGFTVSSAKTKNYEN